MYVLEVLEFFAIVSRENFGLIRTNFSCCLGAPDAIVPDPTSALSSYFPGLQVCSHPHPMGSEQLEGSAL